MNPAEVDGQESNAALVPVLRMAKGGEPGVWTKAMMPQKPPRMDRPVRAWLSSPGGASWKLSQRLPQGFIINGMIQYPYRESVALLDSHLRGSGWSTLDPREHHRAIVPNTDVKTVSRFCDGQNHPLLRIGYDCHG